MKVWVCETSHENDCAIFATEELGWRHFNSCQYCESLVSYEGDGELKETFRLSEYYKGEWVNQYTGLCVNPMSTVL